MRPALLSFCLLAFASCGGGPSEEKCKELLDHMVALEAESAGGAASSVDAKALEKQKAEMKRHLEENFTSYCKGDLPADQVECALKARSLEAVAACAEK